MIHAKVAAAISLAVLIAFVSCAVALDLASFNVPGHIIVSTPKVSLKLANNPDMSSLCDYISWNVVRGNGSLVQTKYLRNVGEIDVRASYVATIPQGFTLTVTYHHLEWITEQWTPMEQSPQTWVQGSTVTLKVRECLAVYLRLDMSATVADGGYDFNIVFSGSG